MIIIMNFLEKRKVSVPQNYSRRLVTKGLAMEKNKTSVIDEKTPLMVLAGPMFLELLLNTMLHNVDTDFY